MFSFPCKGFRGVNFVIRHVCKRSDVWIRGRFRHLYAFDAYAMTSGADERVSPLVIPVSK